MTTETKTLRDWLNVGQYPEEGDSLLIAEATKRGYDLNAKCAAWSEAEMARGGPNDPDKSDWRKGSDIAAETSGFLIFDYEEHLVLLLDGKALLESCCSRFSDWQYCSPSDHWRNDRFVPSLGFDKETNDN